MKELEILALGDNWILQLISPLGVYMQFDAMLICVQGLNNLAQCVQTNNRRENALDEENRRKTMGTEQVRLKDNSVVTAGRGTVYVSPEVSPENLLPASTPAKQA